MGNFFISNNEIFILTLLTVTLILPFNLFNKNNRLTFAHPLIFYSLLMIYYTVLSPFLQIASNETTSKGFDFREQYILGWTGALLSVISVFIGYSFKTKIKKRIKKYCDLDYKAIWSTGLSLNIIGIFLFMIFGGFDISLLNPFYNQSLSLDFLAYRGSLKSYLLYAQEFMVAGNFLMFSSSYSMQRKFPLTLLSLLISTSIFLNSGFRFRIFFLFTSIILFLLIKEEKLKPKLAINLGSLAFILFLIILTFIGQIRTYGAGFNFESLSLTKDFLRTIFTQAESSVFITTSGIINLIPKEMPFQNFYPLFKTLIHPIPGVFFDKDAGDYLFKITNAVYGFKNIYQGAAYLNFGEYYLMFGWFGIFIFNFLMGYIFKRLWLWINLHKEEPLALMLYILNVSYIFMIISRGYLPQQVHIYLFTVFPITCIYFFNLKRKVNISLK